MIGRLARFAVVTLLAATLSSCWLIYSSPFPDFAELILNQIDLGAYLPADRDAEYRIACYDDGATEYLFLFVRGTLAGERLLIFDEQLVLRYETIDTPEDNRFEIHSPIVTKPSGEVFVGLLAFPDGLGEPTTLTVNNLESNQTLYDFPTDGLISVAPNGSALDFVTVFSSPDDPSPGFGAMTIASTGAYGSANAAYSLRTGIAGLATADETAGVVAGFIGTTATITTQHIITGTTLVTNPGGYTFPVTQTIKQIFPVPSGVVLEHEDEDNGLYLTYYDYSGAEGARFFHERNDVRLAFSMAGEHFYLFERERNTIVKVRTWW